MGRIFYGVDNLNAFTDSKLVVSSVYLFLTNSRSCLIPGLPANIFYPFQLEVSQYHSKFGFIITLFCGILKYCGAWSSNLWQISISKPERWSAKLYSMGRGEVARRRIWSIFSGPIKNRQQEKWFRSTQREIVPFSLIFSP